MNIIVYHIGEMVSAITTTLLCLILIYGCYWIIRTKLNPNKIRGEVIVKAMAEAYQDVFINTLFPEDVDPDILAMHDVMSAGHFDVRSFDCMMKPLCNCVDQHNDWTEGTAYSLWLNSFIKRIQV